MLAATPRVLAVCLVPVVLVELREALLVAGVNPVHKAHAHHHLRTVLDETSLQLFDHTTQQRQARGLPNSRKRSRVRANTRDIRECRQ